VSGLLSTLTVDAPGRGVALKINFPPAISMVIRTEYRSQRYSVGSSDPLPARFEMRSGRLNFQATWNGYLMCITNRDELHPWRSTGPGPITATVIEPPKIIPYYRLSQSTWPLSNNKELFRRFHRVKPGESLTTGSRYALSPNEGGTRVQHYIT
jgi:hypothetical protein